ncbi:MAG: hypothetical protein E7337_16500 [Clostridiales bacterium]|nr:hypothetical protein [Clostridiales bacterium]
MNMRFRACAALLLTGLLVFTSCAGPPRTGAPLERFSFSHSGMSTGSIYTLTVLRTDGGWKMKADLFCSHEYEFPMSQEDVRRLTQLIDSHELWKWNGYDRADRHVHDGEGFDLRIWFEDGQEISASGENSFPAGYRAAEDAVKTFFIEIMETNGIKKSILKGWNVL